MADARHNRWEKVTGDDLEEPPMFQLPVPGGWLYGAHIGVAFVPYPPAEVTADDTALRLLLPPSDVDAEQVVLGTLLRFPFIDFLGLYKIVASELKPESFVDPIHGAIFEAVGAVVRAGGPYGLDSVRAILEPSGRLDEVGGPAYLAQLAEHFAPPLDAIVAAKSVRDTYRARAAQLEAEARAMDRIPWSEGRADDGENPDVG